MAEHLLPPLAMMHKDGLIWGVLGPHSTCPPVMCPGRGETKDLSSKRPQHKPIRGQAVVTANYDGIIKDGITALKVLIEPLAIAGIEREKKNECEINICIFRPIYLWVIFPFPFLFDMA